MLAALVIGGCVAKQENSADKAVSLLEHIRHDLEQHIPESRAYEFSSSGGYGGVHCFYGLTMLRSWHEDPVAPTPDFVFVRVERIPTGSLVDVDLGTHSTTNNGIMCVEHFDLPNTNQSIVLVTTVGPMANTNLLDSVPKVIKKVIEDAQHHTERYRRWRAEALVWAFAMTR